MESPSPLSGWVTPEQAILTLQPPFLPSVKWGWWCRQEKPKARWGEHYLHVKCLVLPVTSSLTPPRPSLALPFTVSPFGRGGESE